MHVLIKFNLGLIDIDRQLRATEADLIISKQHTREALSIGKNKLEEMAGSPTALTASFLTGLTAGLLSGSKAGSRKAKSSSTVMTTLISMGTQMALRYMPLILSQIQSNQTVSAAPAPTAARPAQAGPAPAKPQYPPA